MSIFVLGLDPGIFNFGFAVVEIGNKSPILKDFGNHHDTFSKDKLKALHGHGKRSTPDWVIEEIMRSILPWYQNILNAYKIDFVVAESCYFNIPSKSSQQTAELRGLIHWASVTHLTQPRWETLPPTEPKRWLTGSPKATKEMVQRAIVERFNVPELLKRGMDHICDSIGLAVTYALKTKLDDGPP